MLCTPCLAVARALKTYSTSSAFKNIETRTCNMVLKNDKTCAGAIQMTALYLRITPPETMCKTIQLCGPETKSGFIPDVKLPLGVDAIGKQVSGIIGGASEEMGKQISGAVGGVSEGVGKQLSGAVNGINGLGKQALGGDSPLKSLPRFRRSTTKHGDDSEILNKYIIEHSDEILMLLKDVTEYLEDILNNNPPSLSQ
ncbi:unnamed protein product [Caenorhabditis bovis]|uniref:Uncharacterized protein n=1 Tax=Caenorhabditis bovis TaxID=2654633 RepID=A0A8S1E7L5_9PELO|nr:unnamed protein product [Caenorhabditis bovis]